MKVTTGQWTAGAGWTFDATAPEGVPDWIVFFGARGSMEEGAGLRDLRARYPRAVICGCSTGGEILNGRITDETLVAALVTFSHARVRAASARISAPGTSGQIGRDLAAQLSAPDLRHVLVLSDGLEINGSQLVAGLSSALGAGVTLSGGLAGDGPHFKTTVTVLGSSVGKGQVVVIGFYGASLRIRCGQAGGWDAFGPHRLITKSRDNVLYELDGIPALDLYKTYLGSRASGLPATGLLFPLELLSSTTDRAGLVRTMLAVDESTRSLTFAGDLPEGRYVRLMKSSLDSVVSAASAAAEQSRVADSIGGDRLALLVSCVGRRWVLGPRAEEEIDAVAGQLPTGCRSIGFYSYGEVCPPAECLRCELHNQTMVVTMFAEEAG